MEAKEVYFIQGTFKKPYSNDNTSSTFSTWRTCYGVNSFPGLIQFISSMMFKTLINMKSVEGEEEDSVDLKFSPDTVGDTFTLMKGYTNKRWTKLTKEERNAFKVVAIFDLTEGELTESSAFKISSNSGFHVKFSTSFNDENSFHITCPEFTFNE